MTANGIAAVGPFTALKHSTQSLRAEKGNPASRQRYSSGQAGECGFNDAHYNKEGSGKCGVYTWLDKGKSFESYTSRSVIEVLIWVMQGILRRVFSMNTVYKAMLLQTIFTRKS